MTYNIYILLLSIGYKMFNFFEEHLKPLENQAKSKRSLALRIECLQSS